MNEQEIYTKAAIAGFPYSCCCGECYRTEASAWNCGKCRNYLQEDDFLRRVVYFSKTDGTYERIIRE